MIEDDFLNFINSPTEKNFRVVRQSLINSEYYHPYSVELEEASELIEESKYTEAKETIFATMPNLILSPCAHMMLSMIYEQLGDFESAEAESFLAFACLDGILMTGDGSQKNPYLGTRIEDEYDVLHYLNKEKISQALLEDGNQAFDCLNTTDGSEIFFDITDMRQSKFR